MRGIPIDADLVRGLRRSRAWTQEELAAAARCTTRTIQSAERAKPVDAQTVKRIADALEVETAILCGQPRTRDPAARNLDIVLDWHEAFTGQDVGRLLSMHHSETVLELPEVKDMPGGGVFHGLDGHQSHYDEVLATFPVVNILQFHQYAVGDWVFAHPVAIVRSVAGDVEFTLPHVNAMRLREGKIIYRTTYANFSAYRETLPANTPKQQVGS